jgi:ABC-2 type transport system ATP-binding protein
MATGNAILDADAPAVRVRELVKSYANVAALRGIDFEIWRGEIFALLGPNGAGKTTAVEILEGYRTRDAGDVQVLGLDPGRDRLPLKRRIGIVLQSTGVDRYLTVRETVRMYASYYPHSHSIDEVIEVVGLADKGNARVFKLSGGQQRRLDVAIALAGDPELLFLDEPTTGFDPSARHEAWAVVKNLAALGKTVLLTTHYMEEAQHLADRVAVLVDGRIVAEGPPSALANRDRMGVRVRVSLPPDVIPPSEFRGQVADGVLELTPDDVRLALHQLTGWALEYGIALDDLNLTRPSLEDVYLQLTGRTAAGPEAVAGGQ